VKSFIDTGAGVVDADYRGEVRVLLFNHSEVDFEGTSLSFRVEVWRRMELFGRGREGRGIWDMEYWLTGVRSQRGRSCCAVGA
jgi:hypothetical protein